MDLKIKHQKRIRRHKKIRAKIKGTNECPRLCVFRSLKHIYAQLIDDEKAKTLVVASDQELKKTKVPSKLERSRVYKTQKLKKEKISRTGKIAIAYEVGKLLAEKAHKKKIQKVLFDRGGFIFHGRVKALAEGAKQGGLKF